MKGTNLAILLLCIFSVNVYGQQKNNTFRIVDMQTAKPVPSVTIAIVRAGLTITTEKDGIFIIPGDLSKMRDTVIFDNQDYLTLKIPLHELTGKDSVKLQKRGEAHYNVRADFKHDSLLNAFERDDIASFVGLHTQSAEFKYLQIAQKLDAPAKGSVLKEVKIGRLAFHTNNGTVMLMPGPMGDAVISEHQYKYSELEHTTFRVRVYAIDEQTGGPGEDLCNRIIEVKSTDQPELTVKLEKYNIVIPGKNFFVAVEWMRDYKNMGYVNVNDAKGFPKRSFNYRPAIGLLPGKSDKLNIWAMSLNHKWNLYTYHSPDFTDLAISARVGY